MGRKLTLLKPSSPIAPGTHPCAFELSPDGKILYVALANRDAVAAVNIGAGQFSVKGYFDTRLPDQSYFGAEPVALAVNGDGSRLYVANMASDAVAVIDTTQVDREGFETGNGRADRLCAHGVDAHFDGLRSLAVRRKALCCHRQREGNRAEQLSAAAVDSAPMRSAAEPMPTSQHLLYGSLATLDESDIQRTCPNGPPSSSTRTA